eukprot:TRINITY_DN39155_c0_g1_i2.p1 TRINITY_DN39155_c0_g1~~TRINITY_DN39155_c0_g1_i2.p1  ORF type:complete len:166 (-),score=36.91 TRINITY_DN39155_c0_g1_i2:208-705(-)
MSCPECDCNDIEEEDGCVMCNECGHCWEPDENEASGGGKFDNYAVGAVVDCEPVPKKDKLHVLTVDVGEGEPIPVVTNAFKGSSEDVLQYIKSRKVVVAKIGAVVEMDGEEIAVAKTTVGGKVSRGMICDSVMLGWAGGSAGTAVLLPEGFDIGAAPPADKPDLR